MKKIAILAVALITMSSCNNMNQNGNYKVVKVAGQPAEVAADYSPLVFSDQTPMLNKMGGEGWELVNTYTETNTSHPNFGNAEYA